MKIHCLICGKPVADYDPDIPCLCSMECDRAMFRNLGKSYEYRRIAAGIMRYVENAPEHSGSVSASASEPTPQPEAQGTPRQALINRLARALDDKLAAQDNAQYWLDRARQLETELAAEKENKRPWSDAHTKSVIDGQVKEIDRLTSELAAERAARQDVIRGSKAKDEWLKIARAQRDAEHAARQKAESERDNWKAKHDKHFNDDEECVRQWNQFRTERDALQTKLAGQPISIEEANELQDILRTLTNSGTALKTSARELVKRWDDRGSEIAALASEVAELRKILTNLWPFIEEDYYPDHATPGYRAAMEAAKAVANPKPL